MHISPRKVLLTIINVVITTAVWAALQDYKNYKIYEITAQNNRQLDTLSDILKSHQNINILKIAAHKSDMSTILVPPYLEKMFNFILQHYALNYTVLINDVSKILKSERHRNSKNIPPTYPLNVFERYYRHNEINENMEYLSLTYPTRVFVKTFGYSYEKRPLKVITITNGDGRSNKKIIFIDAAMHAQEWITSAMALYIMHELTVNYETHKKLLQDYNWIIMPVVNADGYEYTYEENRLWRKTRRPSSLKPNCYGTDLNSNFDYYWGHKEFASLDPCSYSYAGDKAFSEPETQIVRDVLISYAPSIKWYLSLHSYGNSILLPYGYTNVLPSNYFDMLDIADVGALAILMSTKSIYTYGNMFSVMYPQSGNSVDYAKGKLNISLAMAMGLPAGGFSGFDPPVDQIENIVKEIWIAIYAMAKEVVAKY